MYVFVLLIGFSIPFMYHMTNLFSNKDTSHDDTSQTSPPLTSTMSPRMPVYFLSIGGPNFLESTSHPAYAQLAKVGQEITTKVKPKAIVVFSAHWQAGPSKIEINVAKNADLIYDFYGFPPHYYEVNYPNKGSPEVAEKVIGMLEGAGIEVERVRRGLDHGVWVGFLAGTPTSDSFSLRWWLC